MKKFIFLIPILVSVALAAELGRIKGTVLDDTNNEPLVGADVIIEGTELGSATDADGSFIIPFVPAGTYRITVSYIGYKSVTKVNVLVFSNQTTELSFRLEPTVIKVPPMVVTAQRPMVIKTQTQTRRTVTAKDINTLPITEINQIITLQAGVSTDERGTHIRGGRPSEIAYFVDGILTKAPHYGHQSVDINKQAVEEVGIITGGFDAEYGEALSGVVNIVTREGGEKFQGNLRYTTDEVFFSDKFDKLNYGYNMYELSFGGGLLDMSRLRYFLSGEAMLTDAYESAKYKVPSERFDYKLESKLSYHLPKAKGKLTLSGFVSRQQYMHYQDIWGDLSFIYHLDHNYGVRRRSNLYTIAFNYMPTTSMIIESKLGYTKYSRFRAVRDLEAEAEADRKWYDDYIFKAQHFIDIIPELEEDTLKKNYLVDSMMNYYEEMQRYSAASLRNNPYGATGFFYTVGDQRLWRYEFNRDWQVKLSVTNSIGKVHEVKTGAALTLQHVGWYDNNLPFYRIPFWDIYEKDPVRFAAYAQDRMDFEGIITRLGLRFDYFDSKAAGLENPSDPTDSNIIWAEPKWRISPRLGFSLPITERSKLRFNYGHFFQTPTAHDLYRSTEPMVVWLLLRRYNSVVGNPNLTVEKTIQYEIGYENQVSDLIAFGFIAYYKDIYDLIQTRQILVLPNPYYQVINIDYGNVKGMEFTMKKRLANYWSFDLSYTLQFAKGTASYAWQHYYDIYNQPRDPITGEYPLPNIDYWLDFDERHMINSSFTIDFPEDFMLMPLRNFFTSFIFSFHSGFPYTPTDLKGNKLGDNNSARMPGYINVDANISKKVKIGGLKLLLFSNLYNLFNTEQVTKVYSSTGRPDDDGGEITVKLSGFSTISMSSSYYTPQADYNHDGLNSPEELYEEYLKARRLYKNNPFHWKPGFRARLGIALQF